MQFCFPAVVIKYGIPLKNANYMLTNVFTVHPHAHAYGFCLTDPFSRATPQ